jgi:hypothetical protein
MVKVGCCLLEDFSFSSSLLWPGSLQQVKTKIALEKELNENQQKKSFKSTKRFILNKQRI